MSRIFASLMELGKLHGLQPLELLKPKGRLWLLDIATGAMTPTKDVEFQLPARRKRGNNAVTLPFYGWDALQYVGSNGTTFWSVLQEVVATDVEVSKALIKFLKTPLKAPFGALVGTKQILVSIEKEPTKVLTTEWVVVTYKGRPVTERPLIAKECERLFYTEMCQGEEGVSLLTGQRGPIVKTHDNLRFRGSKAMLFCVNESAMEYYGLEQAANFPITAEESKYYTTGANLLLDNPNAYLTKACALLLWPDGALSHPVIPIVQRLLCGYFKDTDQEEVEKLWKELEACEESDLVINAALFRQNSTRISIRNYETLTASQLRTNFLRFKEEFGPVSFRRIALYTEMDGQPSITAATLWEIAWAVVMGIPYPRAGIADTLSKISLDYEHSRQLWYAWTEALDQRRNPRTRAPLPMSTPSDRDSTYQQAMEIINRRVQADLFMNSTDYRFGCLVAAFCQLKFDYHRGSVDNPKSTSQTSAQNTPEQFYTEMQSMAIKYAERLKAKGGSLIFKGLYDEIVGGLTTVPKTIRNKAQFNLGFAHQDRGAEEYRKDRWEKICAAKAAKEAAKKAKAERLAAAKKPVAAE